MQKIKDRVVLGIVSGVGANVVKLLVGDAMRRIGFADEPTPEKVGGLIMPYRKVRGDKGPWVAYLADSVVAAILGIGGVYALSMSGTDRAALKGAFAGQTAWAALYGVLGSMGAGATRSAVATPEAALSEFVAHTAFGAAGAALIVGLGDPGLFNGEIPVGATPGKKAHAEKGQAFAPHREHRAGEQPAIVRPVQ